jgi:hypothetical protein
MFMPPFYHPRVDSREVYFAKLNKVWVGGLEHVANSSPLIGNPAQRDDLDALNYILPLQDFDPVRLQFVWHLLIPI